MGNCSEKEALPQPDTTNQCGGKIGDTYKLPNFCTLAGVGGNRFRDEWCGKLGLDGEWVADRSDGSCSYNNCGNYQDYDGGGCCGSCCGIVGKGVICRRARFTGNRLQCCINDYNTTKSNGLCFTNNGNRTCDPSVRDISSSACIPLMSEYCSTGTIAELEDRWLAGGPQSDCVRYLDSILLTKTQGDSVSGNYLISPSHIDADGVKTVQDQLMIPLLETLRAGGVVLGSSTASAAYSPMQDILFNVCHSVPGTCTNALIGDCVTDTINSLTVGSGTALLPSESRANWCGCLLQPDQYVRYQNELGIVPECTPICQPFNTIPAITADAVTPRTCVQNFCLIDNVTLALHSSAISITQFCGDCEAGGCICVIADTTIVDVNNGIPGVDINQSCGSQVCREGIFEVDCLTGEVIGTVENPSENRNSDTNTQLIWGIVLAGITAIILILILAAILA